MKLQNCQREILHEAQARDRFSKESGTMTFIGARWMCYVVCFLLVHHSPVSTTTSKYKVFICMWTEHMR